MRILVTNDDGINAQGIKILVDKAKKFGDVFVVAPKANQSATSHKINVKSGIRIEEVDLFPGVKAYSVDSTPADCVRFAAYHLKGEFDIVFSGINNGYNLGNDILYSGTIAGASEANFTHKPGIAFSTTHKSFDGAIKEFDRIMDFVFKYELLKIGKLYNINIPLNPKGIKLTKQGETHFDTWFSQNELDFYQKGQSKFNPDRDKPDSDVYAIYNDYISITPLTSDRTNYDVFNLFINNLE